MDTSIKSVTLITAVVLCGLSAGLFYAWQVSVIPGTRRVIDATYLETMQSINRAILNPAFFLIFFGCLVFLTLSTVQQYRTGHSFWILLGATIAYLIGTVGVTVFGNIPLNDALEAINLKDLLAAEAAELRQFYEPAWNRFHLVRTVFSVISFLLSVLAVFSHSSQ